jgi:ribosomal protein S12
MFNALASVLNQCSMFDLTVNARRFRSQTAQQMFMQIALLQHTTKTPKTTTTALTNSMLPVCTRLRSCAAAMIFKSTVVQAYSSGSTVKSLIQVSTAMPIRKGHFSDCSPLVFHVIRVVQANHNV